MIKTTTAKDHPNLMSFLEIQISDIFTLEWGGGGGGDLLKI